MPSAPRLAPAAIALIPTIILRQVRRGFGLPRGSVRVLSTRFGKVCLAHRASDGTHTQLRLVQEVADTASRLESETAWLTYLASRHALAVPVPMRWGGGAMVSPRLSDGTDQPWRAIACSWVAGRHLNRGLRANDFVRAGALLAHLHLANRDAPEAIAAARPTWGVPRLFELATTLRDLIRAGAEPPAVSTALAEALRGAHSALMQAWDALPAGPTDVGLIHTDAHWQNLRWTRGRVGLVDFEDFATGRFMLDIACLWGKVEFQPGSRAFLVAILEGYDSVRPLPGGARRDLHVMLAFRRFDYAGWVLSWPRVDLHHWGPDLLRTAPEYMRAHLAAAAASAS